MKRMDDDLPYVVGVSVLLILLALFVTALARVAHAQEEHTGHPPEHMELHEKFYKTWLRPDANMRNPQRPDGQRVYSCCNDKDCYPTKFKREGGTWFFWGRESQSWREVPDHLMEQNQLDPRESPDGQGHVCANENYVFCAVLGSGV